MYQEGCAGNKQGRVQGGVQGHVLRRQGGGRQNQGIPSYYLD